MMLLMMNARSAMSDKIRKALEMLQEVLDGQEEGTYDEGGNLYTNTETKAAWRFKLTMEQERLYRAKRDVESW